MSLMDLVVDSRFGMAAEGQVIFMPPPASLSRHQPRFLIKSKDDERKIRSFLKMLYIGHFSITFLGLFLASRWSSDICYAWGSVRGHMLRTMGLSAGVMMLVYGLPEMILWRAYARELPSYTSGLEETATLPTTTRRSSLLIAGMAVATIAILLGGAILLTSKR